MQFLFNKCLGCVFGNAFGLKIIFPRLTFSKSACKFCLESLQWRGLINCSQLFKSVKMKKLSRVCPHSLKSLTNQVLSNLWFQVNRRSANSLRIFNVWKRLRNVLKGQKCWLFLRLRKKIYWHLIYWESDPDRFWNCIFRIRGERSLIIAVDLIYRPLKIKKGKHKFRKSFFPRSSRIRYKKAIL